MSANDLDYVALLHALPDPSLLLTPEFVVVEANPAYVAATTIPRSDLVDQNLFEVLPDRGDESTAAIRAVRASLAEVLRTRETRTSGIGRYDLPVSPGGRPRRRYWSPANSPILNSRDEVQFILHRGLDVTAARGILGKVVVNAADQLADAGNSFDPDVLHFAEYMVDSRSDDAAQPELRDQIAELAAVIDARSIIEQAKGVLMATAHISADQAIALLKAQSQHTNTKVRDVAADLVAAQQRILGDLRSTGYRVPAPAFRR